VWHTSLVIGYRVCVTTSPVEPALTTTPTAPWSGCAGRRARTCRWSVPGKPTDGGGLVSDDEDAGDMAPW